MIWIWQTVCDRVRLLFLRGKEAFPNTIRYAVLFGQEVVNSFKEQQAATQEATIPGNGILANLKTGKDTNQQTKKNLHCGIHIDALAPQSFSYFENSATWS